MRIPALEQRGVAGGQQAVLHLVDACLSESQSSSSKTSIGLLQDDRARVRPLVHEEHRDPGHLHPVGEGVRDAGIPGNAGRSEGCTFSQRPA